jgi:hypothetical protein
LKSSTKILKTTQGELLYIWLLCWDIWRYVCKLLIGKLENKNPSDVRELSQWTHLHVPAGKGHGEICKLIANKITDKNPVTVDGLTPHQLMT